MDVPPSALRAPKLLRSDSEKAGPSPESSCPLVLR